MAVNGKNKGSNYERKISNLLSNRFEKFTEKPKSFIRNSDSGAYYGGTNVSRVETHNTDFAVYGDLVCPRNFKFSIECKFYKTPPSWAGMVNHKVTQWDTWIAQSTQDSITANKEFCLIVKYNNVSDTVFLKKSLNNELFYSKYQNLFIYKLDDWLTMPDEYFFEI